MLMSPRSVFIKLVGLRSTSLASQMLVNLDSISHPVINRRTVEVEVPSRLNIDPPSLRWSQLRQHYAIVDEVVMTQFVLSQINLSTN